MKSIQEIQADDERRKALDGMDFEFDIEALLKTITWMQLRLYSAITEAQNEANNEQTRRNWHIVANETNKTLLWFDEYVIIPATP